MPGEDMYSGAVQQVAGNIGAGLSGAISGITGYFQKKKGNQILKDNPRPTEEIPQDVLENQQMARQMANEGLPSEQYQQAQKNIQRQQATALNASQDRRGALATVGAIQQGTNDATGNLDAENANARRQNQLNLMNVNNTVAGWRDKTWQWNQQQRYIQAYNTGNALVGIGNSNMTKGADKLLSGIIGAGTGAAISGNQGGAMPNMNTPAANSYRNMAPVEQGGSAGSPAANYLTLNPNGYSTSALIQ